MNWWHVKSNTLINMDKVSYIRCFIQPTENNGDVPTLRFFFEGDEYISVYFESAQEMGDCFEEIKKDLDAKNHLANTP